MGNILVLEQDEYIRRFAVEGLQRAGYTVIAAASGQWVLDLPENGMDLDGALLDVSVADADIARVCQQLRQNNPDMVILLTADNAGQTDAVTALMTGADDCMAKPFSQAELCCRMEQMLSAGKAESVAPEQILSSGPFILNTATGALTKLEQSISLTRAEYTLLRLLLAETGRAYSCEELEDVIWNDGCHDRTRLTALIRRLRIKMEDDPSKPEYITTVWGYGYQWR